MLLNILHLLPLVAAYNTFQNAATVDPATYTATTEDGHTLLIDTYNFKTWSMDERQYVGQWNPFDKLRNGPNDTGIDMLSHFRDESGNLLGSYDEETGEISNNGQVVGHANDTGFFDASGIRRGLAKSNSTRQFYAPDQSFIGGLFMEPKVGPGSDGFTWDSLNKDYKDIAATIGPKAGVVRDLSGFLTPRTRFYIRDKEFGDGAELVYLRNNTLDTLQIETDYTFQLPLSRISVNYTMSVDTGRFDFGDNEDDFIQYSNSSMMFNNELWGMFMKMTGFGAETNAAKSDLDLSPIVNLSFVDSNQSPIGGVYNLDIILDSDNNFLYAINPNTLVVSDGEGNRVGTFNASTYSLVSINNTNPLLGQIVLKNEKSGSASGNTSAASGNASASASGNTGSASGKTSAPASSASSTSTSANANTNGAGSTLPTAAAALVIPFFLLMV